MLISDPANLVLTVGLGHFDGKLVELSGSGFLDEVDEHEIVQALLQVLGDQLEVGLSRVEHVNGRKSGTRLPLGGDIRVQNHIAVSQVAYLEDRGN